MTHRTPIYAGMATMPGRLHTFRRAVKSLLPQVDRLYLFLDRFPAALTQHPKITLLPSQQHGDLRANGKLLGLIQLSEPGIYLTTDDDILYPPDYALRMQQHLEGLGAGAVAAVHGSVLKRESFRSYIRDRSIYLRDGPLSAYRRVDVVATCTAAFRTQDLCFDVRQWSMTNMVDLHFSLECERRGLNRHVVPREKGWITSLQVNQPDSIFAQLMKDDTRQTELARQLIAMSASAAPIEVKP